MQDEYLNEVLIFDIETDSVKVEDAKLKFFGAYSYKTNKYYMYEHTSRKLIQDLINSHKVLCGFNSNNYDIPVLENNGISVSKYKIKVDCLSVLKNTKTNTPNRSTVMIDKNNKPLNEVLKNYKLNTVAEALGFEISKGEIDYNIFKQNSFTDKDRQDIYKYLELDVKLTKKLFDYLLNYFDNLKQYVNEDDKRKFNYIRSSLGAFTYSAFCNMLSIPIKYEEDRVKLKERPENKGGFVLIPTEKYCEDVIYFDFSSLYPMIFLQNNLFSHSCDCCFEDDKWEGGEFFDLKGSYCCKKQGEVEQLVEKIYNKRLEYKKNKDPRQQALKIMINTLYGVTGSPKFKHFYHKYTSGDCTRIGRKCIKTAIEMFNLKGFSVVYADTDSCFVKLNNKTKKEAVKVADEIAIFLQSKMQFPCKEFDFKIDDEFKKLRLVNRKQYFGITQDNEFVIKGLDVKQHDSSKLGQEIFKFMKSNIDKSINLQFNTDEINKLIAKELKKDITLISQTYNVKSKEHYKNNSSIQAQISNLSGEGVYELVPNKKIGSFGESKMYCTPEQAKKYLKIEDLHLDKTLNELKPFLFDENKPLKENVVYNESKNKKSLHFGDVRRFNG